MNILTCLCYLILFLKVNECNACTPFDRNIISEKRDVENFKIFLKKFALNQIDPLPVFNNVTVPDYQKIIEEFQNGKANPDVHLNFTQLVTKYGYPVERHEVVTEDKYCLTLFRIPNPRAPVVFLMHGLLGSSDDWIAAGTRIGLAYVLADAGYDVWLGNARGNRYSRCHLKLSPDCGEFWDFSFDQIGRYDLPAMIDYTLEKTITSKLLYVGHSQGNTAFYVMTSVKPEYNEKISIMVCLSAVVFMTHVRSPLVHVVAPFIGDLDILAKVLGVYELIPRDAVVNAVTSTFCGSPDLAEIFCQFIMFLGCGFNYSQINSTMLPVVYGHYPAGASTKQAIHYTQGVISSRFQNYDYGPLQNMLEYGAAVPPDYPLQNVSCPIALFYSTNDWLTSTADIVRFLNIVPNVVEFYRVPCALYDHFDYLFAKDNDILINREVLRILKEYVDF
ncbi:lipase 3-like [Amyelois transitella]|uniref:lipase 3-like n=1 Tax=Amyelois transitella TaxID=680683 RepID=UPI00067AEB36|nr:lipase 3-like [Amyelois transitella]